MEFNNGSGEWVTLSWDFDWLDEHAYRIKPEPMRETMACWWGSWGFTLGNQSCRDTHRITFTTTDGKPDLDSIRMEALG